MILWTKLKAVKREKLVNLGCVLQVEKIRLIDGLDMKRGGVERKIRIKADS